MDDKGGNRGLIGGTILANVRRTTENFKRDRMYPGRDANTGSPSHEAQSLPTRVDWHTLTRQTYCQNAFITNPFIDDSNLLSQK